MSFIQSLEKTASDLGNLINSNIKKTMAATPPTPPPAPTTVGTGMSSMMGSIRKAFGGT